MSLRSAGAPCLVLLAMLACPVAASASAGPIELGAAWSRPTPPGAMGAAYLVITNHGTKPDRLVSASTPAAASVEIDSTREVDGVSQMRAVAALDVPAGRSVRLQPGGFHIMLMDLARPLARGMRYPLTLRFRDAGAITVQVEVRDDS